MFQIFIDSDDINLEKTPPQSPLTHQGKHALTPESKAATEKNPKQFSGTGVLLMTLCSCY